VDEAPEGISDFVTGAVMQIGELARRVGIDVDTVRLYEQQGLLPRLLLPGSDYRQYEPEDVQRLRFIRRVKALGFTLAEIAELLEFAEQQHEDIGDLQRAAEIRLQALEARIAELSRLRTGLRQLVSSCPEHGASAICQILAAAPES
jgi:DNA-binding transcriptional MerR regulator